LQCKCLLLTQSGWLTLAEAKCGSDLPLDDQDARGEFFWGGRAAANGGFRLRRIEADKNGLASAA
jgi:hypothetical protein